MQQLIAERTQGNTEFRAFSVSSSLRSFVKVSAGVLATLGPLTEKTRAQEPGSPTGLVAPAENTDTQQQTDNPALTPEFKAGYERGFLAGRVSVVVETLRADIKAVSLSINSHGSPNEKAEWQKQEQEITARLAALEKQITPTATDFDPARATRDLAGDVRVVNSFNLLAKRLESSSPPAAAPAPAPQDPSNLPDLTLEHGEIVSLDVYRKLLQPFVDQLSEQMHRPDQQNPGTGGLPLPQQLPRPDNSQLEIFRGIGDRLREGLDADVQRIKEKRARDAAERAKVQRTER